MKLNPNQVNIENGNAINVDLLARISPKRRSELEKFGTLNAQSVKELFILLAENFIIKNATTTLILMYDNHKIGRHVTNISAKWYKRGGSFCSICHLGFTFIETYAILLMCEERKMKHGLPRCMYCGKSLRTRSKSDYKSGFWNMLKEK